MKLQNLNKFLDTNKSKDSNGHLKNFGFDGSRLSATDGYRLVSLQKELFEGLPDTLLPGQVISKSGVNFDPIVSYPNTSRILNSAKLTASTGERLIISGQLRHDLQTLKGIQVNRKQLMFFGGGDFTESHKYNRLLLDSQRGNIEIIDTQSITRPYSVSFKDGKIYTGYQVKQITRYREHGRKTVKKLEQCAQHTVRSEHASTYCFQNINASFNLEYLISILETALELIKTDNKLAIKYYQSCDIAPLWFSIDKYLFSGSEQVGELLLMPIKP